MINENEAVQRLCLHEGIRLQPYRCPAGYLTIGVGRNLETNQLTVEEKKVCGDWQHGITKTRRFFCCATILSASQPNVPNEFRFGNSWMMRGSMRWWIWLLIWVFPAY